MSLVPPVIILDGGCGLELKRRKALHIGPQPVAYDLTLLSTAALRDTPDAIVALHQDYIRAGCTAITTTSYACTRHYLDKVGQGDRVEELAARSVALAREAVEAEDAAGQVLVVASVPPLGESYQSCGLPHAQAEQQYETLLQGLAGCDAYLCETFATLAEGSLAVRMCKRVHGPTCRVWLSFTPRRAAAHEDGGQHGVRVVADGSAVANAVEAAVSAGAEALLFNCATPELVGVAIDEARAQAAGRLRLGGYGNFWQEADPRGWSIDQSETGAGKGDQKTCGFVVRTDLTHSKYAGFAREWLSQGATIVGGCCGVGPGTMAEVCLLCR